MGRLHPFISLFVHGTLCGVFVFGLCAQVTPARVDALADTLPPATIVVDEGGPVAISGELSYTDPFFTIGTAAPMVILEDQAGFVDRDEGYILPVASQTLGQITSDFYTSPFSYTLSLPIEPQAALRDVDQDGEDDPGVMIFAVAYWTNVFGDPFLEERDLFGGGWPTAYASTRVSNDAPNTREIVGGTLLVYAPDEKQGFPTGFGADGLLFTEDDPIARLPQGYTLVRMGVDAGAESFTFDRSRYPAVQLVESKKRALEDYSMLAYGAAFDALIERLRRTYAFTEHKGIDWDALHRQFRPRVEEAEVKGDRRAFLRVLRDFSFEIPDGHVNGPFVLEDFRYQTAGGLGLAIRELDDGRVVVSYVVDGGPADQAGIALGAEIFAINGLPINEHVTNTVALSAPFSTAHIERLQKLRYAVRWPLGSEVELLYRNPDSEAPALSFITTTAENESFSYSSFNVGLDGFQLPLEFTRLESGHGYVKIHSFSDNELLTVQLWERLIHTLNDSNTPGLVVDMRQNGGGSSFLADQLAAYFFDEGLALGNVERYDESLGDFYFDPSTVTRFYPPSPDLRYDGAVALLIGPNCNSACEFFAHDMTLENRAAVVGQYPTAGLGGSIDVALLPENVYFQYTAGRAVDMNGDIVIEGKGVAPTIRVPVDEETLFSDGDPVLEAAVQHLNERTKIDLVDAGKLDFGGAVTGLLEPNKRFRYTLTLKAGDVVDLYLRDGTARLDTVLRLYDRSGALLASNDDTEVRESANSAIEHFEVPVDLTLIVEAATYGDALSGEYILSAEIGDRLSAPMRAEVVAEVDAASDSSAVSPETASTPQPTAEPEGPTGQVAVVRTEGARLIVRSGPGDGYERIGYLPDGSSHRVLAASGDGAWLQIEVTDLDDYESGWIASAFVEVGQ